MLTGCHDKIQLNGIWMGNYINVGLDQNVTTKFMLPEIIEICEDSIHIKTFETRKTDNLLNVNSYPYSIEKRMLIFNNDTFDIFKITADSLILRINNNELVYNRLNDSQKISDPVNITEGIYTLRLNGQNIDTLVIFDNHTLLQCNRDKFYDKRIDSWIIDSYKNYYVFMYDKKIEPPFLILYKNDSIIDLISFGYNLLENEFDLLRLCEGENCFVEDTNLFGKWKNINPRENDLYTIAIHDQLHIEHKDSSNYYDFKFFQVRGALLAKKWDFSDHYVKKSMGNYVFFDYRVNGDTLFMKYPKYFVSYDMDTLIREGK